MRYLTGGLLAMMLMLSVLTGCATKHAVVLVADPDGHVGKAEVITEGGAQRLEKAGDVTHLAGKSAPPSPVATADPKYIETTFGEALGVEPLPSEKFTLLFETGGAALAAESQSAIADIVAAIKRRGAISVRISGHSDSVGSIQINDAISLERATRVKDLLVADGVDSSIVEVSSHGKGNPLILVPDGVAEPRNRRVEVIAR